MAQYLENPRKAPRARLRCRVRASSGSARFEAVTEDLGPIGCQLVAPCQLAPGSPVALVVHADGLTTPLEVVGVVAWSSAREPWRFGVAFEDEEHPAAAAFFAALAAAHPGLSDWQRVPARIPLDATVWLAPPPRRVVDFGPDEVAVLRAVGSGATVFELLARLRDRGTAGQRAFFSLLAGRHVTLLRGGAVPVANWSSLLRTLEAELAVSSLSEPPGGPAVTRPAPAPGPVAPAPPSSGRFASRPAPAPPGVIDAGGSDAETLELDVAPRRGAGRRPLEAEEAYRLAEQELAAGRAVSALALLRRALALAPGDLEIARTMGEVASGKR